MEQAPLNYTECRSQSVRTCERILTKMTKTKLLIACHAFLVNAITIRLLNRFSKPSWTHSQHYLSTGEMVVGSDVQKTVYFLPLERKTIRAVPSAIQIYYGTETDDENYNAISFLEHKHTSRQPYSISTFLRFLKDNISTTNFQCLSTTSKTCYFLFLQR